MFGGEWVRYLVWGPIVGLALASFLFLFGYFGADIRMMLMATAVLSALGFIMGGIVDSNPGGNL
ncbi:MAG: hypothetical protein FD145_1541 [Candidatus Saganbacteria bacterium]|uniref:Uncharacterized protein n=1 Tax=Candidatus Saganbacteria bacterium TaxID=2575572 RepID=A0A833KZZ4_UNCSA|nr:MAG: hypothetical protein FD145_1541 [Candidatus Saganbacteria bacterium]